MSKQTSQLSFDELINEASVLEEKGEKYVSGPKARRFYERACEFYQSAIAHNPHSFNTLYNYSRLLLHLSQFEDPPNTTTKKFELLTLAIQHSRVARDLWKQEKTEAGEEVDNLFNLVTAMHLKADVLVETDQSDTPECMNLLNEAKELCMLIWDLQRKQFAEVNTQPVPEEPPSQIETSADDEEMEVDDAEYEDMIPERTVTIDGLCETVILSCEITMLIANVLLDTQPLVLCDKLVVESIEFLRSFQSEYAVDTVDLSLCFVELLKSRADLNFTHLENVIGAGGAWDLKRLESCVELYEIGLTEIYKVAESKKSGEEERVCCEVGDYVMEYLDSLYFLYTELNKIGQSNEDAKLGAEKLLTKLKNLFLKAISNYEEAKKANNQNAKIFEKLGDCNLKRLRIYFDAKTRGVLGSNALMYYQQAYFIMKGKDEFTFTDEYRKVDAVRVVMMKSASAMGFVSGKEKERENVLNEIKRQWQGDLAVLDLEMKNWTFD
ncbi:hypothetical protein HK098_003293 [Nowakowskiella sp. JEL0407]|nr:hypothetical protein HK098_003293 [Nowakowskiella sp. JEL0407]